MNMARANIKQDCTVMIITKAFFIVSDENLPYYKPDTHIFTAASLHSPSISSKY